MASQRVAVDHGKAAIGTDYVSIPAIVDPQFRITDILSLAICGYIGGRFVFLRAGDINLQPGTAAWYAAGVVSALITSFGGGGYYTFMMKKSPRSFACMDPLNVTTVLVGYFVSLFGMVYCSEGEPWCDELFKVSDCTNCAILIAWGASKSLMDTVGQGLITRFFWALLATYTYSFGGGITRDIIGIGLGATDRIGNLDVPSVVAPAMVGGVIYLLLLTLRLPTLLELGLGLPAVFIVFFRMPELLS